MCAVIRRARTREHVCRYIYQLALCFEIEIDQATCDAHATASANTRTSAFWRSFLSFDVCVRVLLTAGVRERNRRCFISMHMHAVNIVCER